MMLAGDDALVQLGRTILSALEDAYATHRVTLPARRYLTIGEPVNDCEQLVVSYLQHYQGLPGDEASLPQPCNVPRSAVFTVALVRTMPIEEGRNQIPTPTAIQTASEALLVDAHIIVDTLVNTDPFQLGTIVTCEVGNVSGGLATIVAQTALAIP